MKDAAKVNLIPFNPYPGTRFARPTEEAIRAFQKQLNNAGMIAPVREGYDILEKGALICANDPLFESLKKIIRDA